MFTDGSQAAAQNVFMTTASGVDNPTMSASQPDAIALAGLPSYDEVVAHSDIYASSLSTAYLRPHSTDTDNDTDILADSSPTRPTRLHL